MKIRNILFGALAFALVSCNQSAKEETNTLASNVDTKPVENTLVSANKPTSELKEVDPNAKYAKFEFEKSEHNFGTIQQGDVVEQTFKFKNVGEVPLVITKIDVTCGCTTPSYTKEPVAPGETGEILVKFNSAGKQGLQNKVSTILANVEGGQDKITIITNVDVPAAGPLKNEG